MSAIYFHSQDDTARVAGMERAAAGCLCGDLFTALLDRELRDDGITRPSILRGRIPAEHYAHTSGNFRESFRLAYSGVCCGECPFIIDDKRVNAFHVQLNTVLAVGSDPVKLMARLHGQCEIHAYVRGENREWLAGIIGDGLRLGIMRQGMGWDSVIELLKSDDASPIVSSYSVCESFPNAGVAGWKDDYDGEGWYDVEGPEQWRMEWEKLSADPWLELKPDNFGSYYFGDGFTAFDLLKPSIAGVGAHGA